MESALWDFPACGGPLPAASGRVSAFVLWARACLWVQVQCLTRKFMSGLEGCLSMLKALVVMAFE